MSVKSFKDLLVWQKAHSLVLEIYKITKIFPSEEKFGLVSQMRRAACSIPTNIVEGHTRKSRKEFLYFLSLANGSLEETKYHIILSKDLDYLKKIEFDRLMKFCDEIGKMLFSFQRKLNA